MTAPSFTWSRFAANPVEHIADPDNQHAQPLCGAYLNPGYQHIAEHASGLFPVCKRCEARWARRNPTTAN